MSVPAQLSDEGDLAVEDGTEDRMDYGLTVVTENGYDDRS